MIPLAHEYQMMEMLLRCESAIMTETSAPKETNIANFHLATRYNLTNLREHSTAVVVRLLSCDSILQDKHFLLLHETTRMDLITKKLHYVEGLLFERKIVPLRRGNVIPVAQVFRHMPASRCNLHRDQTIANANDFTQSARVHVQAGALPKGEACDRAYRVCCIEEYYGLMEKFNNTDTSGSNVL